MKQLCTLLFVISTFTGLAQGQFSPFDEPSDIKTEASLVAEVASTAPGETFTIAINLKHQVGWHSYFKNPGGPGLALAFDWNLPAGYQLKKLHWPTPHLYTSGTTQFYVYENQYQLLADISSPVTAKVGKQANISVTPTWQLCNETGCDQPVSEELSLSIPVNDSQQLLPEQATFFKSARSKLPKANKQWDVTAEINKSNLVLTIKTKDGSIVNLKEVHYVDNLGLTDPEQKQSLEDTGESYILKAALNEDATPGDRLTGLLIFENHDGVEVDLALAGNSSGTGITTSTGSNQGHGRQDEAPTEADIAAAAKLYDADQKIDFVLLDGTKEKSHSLATALGFIFIGGFLLNLMPCVFPVLGIKVMGFAQQSGSEPRKIKIHGLVFMMGLVVSMWVLAGIIYTLIFAFGRDINWGEQLTSPIFLAALIMFLYLFGLNMAGLFEIGTSLTGAGGELQSKKGYSGSFFSGVLTTLIATPCSGPFLGSVMGFTLKQPPFQGMIIFTVFALGISAPYVVLAFFPKLINKLPKPGAWMVTFKQVMAFALFATAAYFFRSFAKITGTGGASWLLMAVVVIGLAAWAYGRFGTPYTPKLKKLVWGFGFPLLVATGAFLMTKSAAEERAPTPPLTGSSWYPGVVELNRSKGRIVWVDYTADW